MTEDEIELAANLIQARNSAHSMLIELADETREMSLSLRLGKDQSVWDTTAPIPHGICMAALRVVETLCSEALMKIAP